MTAFCWFVRAGENEELRMSIRSVHAHFPDAPLFIVGDKPDWVTGIRFLKGNPTTIKHVNVWRNLEALAAWDEVPEDIVIMNDDFYITTRVDPIPVLYRSTLREHIESLGPRTDWWAESLNHTARLLPADALSYELHTPFPARKSLLHRTLNPIDPGPHPPQWRTLYGNQWHTNPTQAADVKITANRHQFPPGPFASTSDSSFRWTRARLAETLPNKSPYER